MHVNLTFEKFALIQCNVNFFCIVKVNCFINQQRVLITAQLIKKFADESGSRNELKGVLIALIPSLSPKSPSFSPYLPILKPVQRLHHATQAKHRTDHRHRSKTRKSNKLYHCEILWTASPVFMPTVIILFTIKSVDLILWDKKVHLHVCICTCCS